MRVGTKTGTGLSIRVWDVRPHDDGTYTWHEHPPLPDWLRATDTGSFLECHCPICRPDDHLRSPDTQPGNGM
jgi:hypothetical protein